ncbi:hypothetical protein [Nafulsella turpanensis]|uniref:hypothetical protein n=1 Tax=Nafulsella turpanensis TaxID=1265690 RepID=UPI00035D0E5B|nr:hypothetical protein [Nafulsella turpanensis]
MKNYKIGLGIFALVFSFHLLLSGLLETNKVSQEPILSQCDPHETIQAVQADFSELTSPDGVLQHKTEISELHQQVRKFPALVSVLFSQVYKDGSERAVCESADPAAFLSFKDFPVAYHNLRI